MTAPEPSAADLALGREMHALAARLFALPRSLTGDGVRATLAALGELVPLTVVEVPTGTPVLDWTVPKEWNLRRAVLRGPGGEIVADTARRNLEVVGYSVPVRGRFPLAELRPRLHSLPDKPDLVPYRTSYWQENWGFCLPHRVLAALPDGEYEVEIDTTLADGHLTYGELLLPGASPAEILVSCHVCHPALANDNLSGLAVSAFLARELVGRERRWSWRFLWAPGTIGAITWLARNEAVTARIRAGLVAANLGDSGAFHYKRSRRGDTEIDRAVEIVLRDLEVPHALEEFVPFGYDERQYCSPGFDLPVGLLSRTPWGRFPEYHTSADDLDFIRPEALAGSLAVYRAVAEVLEGNRRCRNLSPKGEPQLGRRGLYRALGGDDRGRERELAMLWVLNQSDGGPDLLAIARRSGLPFERLRDAAAALAAAGLIAPDPD